MLGIVFALVCLVLTSFNDFVFKLFARKERSKGLFFALIGVVWLISMCWIRPAAGINWKATLLIGCISGFFSATANLLLIEGMARQSAGLCSLIYRLNMVPVVIGGALLLHEKLSVFEVIGILFALAAIFLFQRGSMGKSPSQWAWSAIVMVGIAALLRAAMGLCYRYGFTHGADKDMVPVINSFFWIVEGILFAVIRERKQIAFDRKMWGYSLISGVLVAGIVLFMAWSLAYGQAVIVLPIAQMSFIATFVLGVIFLKERCTPYHIVSILLGIVAVILLAV